MVEKKKTAKRSKAAKKVVVNADLGVSSVEKVLSDAPPIDARALFAGTVVFLPGSNTPLVLQDSVMVRGAGIERDVKFVGMLMRDRSNFNLNINQIEGVWSPITGRREE